MALIIIYRNHAVAAGEVAFPIFIFLSKYKVMAVRYLVDKSKNEIGMLV